VRQVAAAIGVPEAIIRKAPSADLWPGQTDEQEAGFTYHELDRLLFNTPEADRATFVDGAVGPLVAHDARYRTNLVETLEVYLAARKVAVAARRMYVHTNTLANRLERIAEIIGPFVDDPDRCLTLGLALRLRRSPRR